MFPFAPYPEPLYPLIPSPNTSLQDFSTTIAHVLLRARQNTTIFSVAGEGVSYRISLASAATDDAAITTGCEAAAEESGELFSGWALMLLVFPVLITPLVVISLMQSWCGGLRKEEERLRMERYEERMRKDEEEEEMELERWMEEGKAKREVAERRAKKDAEERQARREMEDRQFKEDIEAIRVDVNREIKECYGMIKEAMKKADERRVRREAEEKRVWREVVRQIESRRAPARGGMEADEGWCDVEEFCMDEE